METLRDVRDDRASVSGANSLFCQTVTDIEEGVFHQAQKRPLFRAAFFDVWLREPDLNRRPSGYEPDELPDCSIPRLCGGILQRVAGVSMISFKKVLLLQVVSEAKRGCERPLTPGPPGFGWCLPTSSDANAAFSSRIFRTCVSHVDSSEILPDHGYQNLIRS